MYEYTKQEMDEIKTNTGESLQDLSSKRPLLLVFLRHFGCTFCRQALADISEKRKQIEQETTIVFVHMTDNETAEEYFRRFKLIGSIHISDPECNLYQQFGLVRGNFSQLFGLNTWIKGFQSGYMKGLGIGKFIGDGFQMPGVFYIKNGKVQDKFIHKLASDRPDYEALAQCCTV